MLDTSSLQCCPTTVVLLHNVVLLPSWIQCFSKLPVKEISDCGGWVTNVGITLRPLWQKAVSFIVLKKLEPVYMWLVGTFSTLQCFPSTALGTSAPSKYCLTKVGKLFSFKMLAYYREEAFFLGNVDPLQYLAPPFVYNVVLLKWRTFSPSKFCPTTVFFACEILTGRLILHQMLICCTYCKL